MNNIFFVKSVYDLRDLPKLKLPEIVLCGRSNVGKSSMINSLYNQKGLAKTSSTPGKTRSINYYSVNDKYYIVDLPGYGFAKASAGEQKKWTDLIQKFFSIENKNIFVFHLIDSRHKPTNLDELLKNMVLSKNFDYTIILNKIDKCNQSQKAAAIKNIEIFLGEEKTNRNYFLFSAVTGLGKKEIVKKIENVTQHN